MKYILLIFAALSIASCGSGGCPAIFIPTHEVTVIDDISGEQICWIQRGASSSGDCVISFDSNESNVDIRVELQGYETEIVKGVTDLSGTYTCFDQHEYTTKVEVFLSRS